MAAQRCRWVPVSGWAGAGALVVDPGGRARGARGQDGSLSGAGQNNGGQAAFMLPGPCPCLRADQVVCQWRLIIRVQAAGGGASGDAASRRRAMALSGDAADLRWPVSRVASIGAQSRLGAEASIRTWLSDARDGGDRCPAGTQSLPFVILPRRASAGDQQVLRVLYQGAGMPRA